MLDFPKFYPDQIVPPERFGDRESQINQIGYTLDAILESRPRGAMISGERGIGKTSMLAKVEQICLERNFLPLLVSLHEFESPGEFFDTLFEEIDASVKKIGLWQKLKTVLGEFSKEWNHIIKIKRKPKTLQAAAEIKFTILLEKMKAHNQKSLVFLLDESDGLKKYIVSLQILRNIWTALCKQGYNLSFFFAGSENLVQDLGQYSPLKRHCIPIELGRFTESECLTVIDKLQEGCKNKLPLDLKKKISSISGGFPHYIHVLGNYISLALKQKAKNPWKEAFRNYLLEINEFENIIKLSEKISDVQKSILRTMNPFTKNSPKELAKKSGVNAATIPVQLNRLSKHNIVKRTGWGAYELVNRSLVEFLRLE